MPPLSNFKFVTGLNSFSYEADVCEAYTFWAPKCSPFFQYSEEMVIFVAENALMEYEDDAGTYLH